MQVAQFGDTLMAAWKTAINSSLDVNCGKGEPGRKKAVHLRYRLYMLRTAMKKEKHDLYSYTLKIKLSILSTLNGWLLQSSRVDSDLEDVLRQSGVALPETPELPQELVNDDTSNQ